jgi:hypothetical protein
MRCVGKGFKDSGDKPKGDVLVNKDFHGALTGLRSDGDALLPVGGEFERHEDVLPCEFGEVVQYFLDAHTGGEVAKDVFYRNAHIADAGLAGAFARLYGDDILVDGH